MIAARDAVIWANNDTMRIAVLPRGWVPEDFPDLAGGYWCDPIGASYASWAKMTNSKRIGLMLETAIDLTMQGYSMRDVLRAFSVVPEFKRLGSASYPMCRALTKALLGRCLEPNTMTFPELLVAYGPTP